MKSIESIKQVNVFPATCSTGLVLSAFMYLRRRKVWRPAMAVSYVHQTRVQHDYCQLVTTYLVGKRTDSHSGLQNSLPNCPEYTFPKAAWLGFTLRPIDLSII